MMVRDCLDLNEHCAVMYFKSYRGYLMERYSLTSCFFDYGQDVAKHRRVRYTTVLLSHGTKQEGKIYLSLMKTHFPFCKS